MTAASLLSKAVAQITEPVADDVRDARRKACAKCPHMTAVQALPGVTAVVCGRCNCLIESLTASERHPAYLEGTLSTEMIETKCKHPDGSKWPAVALLLIASLFGFRQNAYAQLDTNYFERVQSIDDIDFPTLSIGVDTFEGTPYAVQRIASKEVVRAYMERQALDSVRVLRGEIAALPIPNIEQVLAAGNEADGSRLTLDRISAGTARLGTLLADRIELSSLLSGTDTVLLGGKPGDLRVAEFPTTLFTRPWQLRQQRDYLNLRIDSVKATAAPVPTLSQVIAAGGEYDAFGSRVAFDNVTTSGLTVLGFGVANEMEISRVRGATATYNDVYAGQGFLNKLQLTDLSSATDTTLAMRPAGSIPRYIAPLPLRSLARTWELAALSARVDSVKAKPTPGLAEVLARSNNAPTSDISVRSVQTQAGISSSGVNDLFGTNQLYGTTFIQTIAPSAADTMVLVQKPGGSNTASRSIRELVGSLPTGPNGAKGDPGRGIAYATTTSDSTLRLTYTDSLSQVLPGRVIARDGKTGAPGTPADTSQFYTKTAVDSRFAANSTDDRTRTNHTGTQPASTITGLATVATTGNYNDLSNKPAGVTPRTDAEIRTAARPELRDTAAVLRTRITAAATQSSTADRARANHTGTQPIATITGVVPVAQIPNLDASKVTTGTFSTTQIPRLDGGKINTGTIDAARIATGTLTVGQVPVVQASGTTLAYQSIPAARTDSEIRTAARPDLRDTAAVLRSRIASGDAATLASANAYADANDANTQRSDAAIRAVIASEGYLSKADGGLVSGPLQVSTISGARPLRISRIDDDINQYLDVWVEDAHVEFHHNGDEAGETRFLWTGTSATATDLLLLQLDAQALRYKNQLVYHEGNLQPELNANSAADRAYADANDANTQLSEPQVRAFAKTDSLRQAIIDIELTPGPKGDQGDASTVPGPPGADGYTPVKGVDYFDGQKGDPGDPATDDQTLSIAGRDLSITGGNTVALPAETDPTWTSDKPNYTTIAQLAANSTADRARANHTGTQPASTITGLATVATTGNYNDLSNKPATVTPTWESTIAINRQTTLTPSVVSESFTPSDILALDANWKKGLLISGAASNGNASGVTTGALAFTKPNNTVAVRSAIAGLQQSTDNDVQGLAFYTHPSPSSSAPVSLSMVLNANGTLLLPNLSGPNDRYFGVRADGLLIEMPTPYSSSNPQPVTLAGDVISANGTTTVEKIRGRNVTTAAPYQGSGLRWNAATSTYDLATIPQTFSDLPGFVPPAKIASGTAATGAVPTVQSNGTLAYAPVPPTTFNDIPQNPFILNSFNQTGTLDLVLDNKDIIQTRVENGKRMLVLTAEGTQFGGLTLFEKRVGFP